MRISKYLSTYLRTEDVMQSITITIASVEPVNFEKDGEQKEKLALRTVELEQPVVLNKTMLKQLCEILKSDDTDQWVGKKATLYKEPNVYYQGKRVGGLRFKEVPPDSPF